VADKLFNVDVDFDAGPFSLHLHHRDVPGPDMLAMEKAFLNLFVQINNSPTPTDTLPRLPQAVLTANITELSDKAGKKHPQPKPFFGPVSTAWHDLPQAATKTLTTLISAALIPYVQYLAKGRP
jgi:hypothetical protein